MDQIRWIAARHPQPVCNHVLFLIEIGTLKLHYGSLGNVTNNRNKKAPVEVKLWRTREPEVMQWKGCRQGRIPRWCQAKNVLLINVLFLCYLIMFDPHRGAQGHLHLHLLFPLMRWKFLYNHILQSVFGNICSCCSKHWKLTIFRMFWHLQTKLWTLLCSSSES